jgi:hypothetical protein
MLSFNPFNIFGMTDYQQFKDFPCLESKSISQIKNMINNQIRDSFRFADRILLLGVPGIGKSTSLYYIYDMLSEAGCNVFLFDRMFIDEEDFNNQADVKLSEVSKKPMYVLVDFPDTINAINFKKFLDYCWNLMKSPNGNNISFIFACNISHYNRSLNVSEILNKFLRVRLDSMNEEESNWLISSRLKMADTENFFDEEVYKIVFKYSRGIPRNIICASKVLTDQYMHKESVNAKEANTILKEEYMDKIINDREENPKRKILYKAIMKILLEDFKGTSTNQTELTNVLKQKLDIGINKSMGFLSDLCKFGLLEFYKGGRNNSEKIWSVKI